MPRIDDYIAAKRLAVETLKNVTIDQLAETSGFSCVAPDVLLVPFLTRSYEVRYPDFQFLDKANPQPVPIQEEVLILHYLMGKPPLFVSGKWVAYREIPGATFYYSAFLKRAVDPLKHTFGSNADLLIRASERLGAQRIEAGDAGFQYLVFPKVPMQWVLYLGDAEFPAEAGILFDQSIGSILSPEDIAWMAGMVVYRLMAIARSLT
mgnify:CR=1 FL=1|uniref:DUF3786 domain-containing protein n=1 Tax=Desulfatirhabdium butyrativorans TaxID=340467 RepID=A0A7C4RP99_9BACT